MNTLLHVVAHIEALPGFEAEVLAALRSFIEPTRAEAGCLRYDLFRDLTDAKKFTFIEEWESKAHLDAHAQSAHIAAGRIAMEGKKAPNWVQQLEQLG